MADFIFLKHLFIDVTTKHKSTLTTIPFFENIYFCLTLKFLSAGTRMNFSFGFRLIFAEILLSTVENRNRILKTIGLGTQWSKISRENITNTLEACHQIICIILLWIISYLRIWSKQVATLLQWQIFPSKYDRILR